MYILLGVEDLTLQVGVSVLAFESQIFAIRSFCFLEELFDRFNWSFRITICFWVVWWGCDMVEFPGKWKLMELLATEMWSVIGNNCVWDVTSTKLLFQHLNSSLWRVSSSSLTSTKSEKLVNNCDVNLSADSEQIWVHPRSEHNVFSFS